jgi:DNA-binding CsgD family transcriptional regulator
MPTNRLGRSLAIGLALIAGFYAVSSFSMPEVERRPAPLIAALVTALIAAQSMLYWQAESSRARVGAVAYFGMQAAFVFLVGLNGALIPVGLALYMALLAEAVVVVGPRFGAAPVAAAGIVVFAINAIVTSQLYFGAMAGLMLAATATVAQAMAALVQRRTPIVAPGGAPAVVAAGPLTSNGKNGWNLTPREEEVLRALATGSQNSDIATQLGIAERTVKAHLQTIYQKLGVDSRTAAVAALLRKDESG